MRSLIAALVVLSSATGFAAGQKFEIPDLGPNVAIFTPATPQAEMQAKIDTVYAVQQHNEFGSERNAFLFLPGEYKAKLPVGFYTQVLGLGSTPDRVHISGDLRCDAARDNNNATTTFWRGVEGLSVTPESGTMQWAVSQAIQFRRMHVQGDLVLHQKRGWASGGWMSDSVIDGNVDSGSQQQWIARNSEWKSWTGSNWNMVFAGVNHPPAGEWPEPPYTKVAKVPVVREKPFLEVNGKGEWGVRVPYLRKDSAGVTWHDGSTAGKWIPLSRFYITKPSDSVAQINAQLKSGRNLIFTPGIYELDSPIQVTKANTVVLGLGFATLKPIAGTAAMMVGDVDGVSIGGLLFDAGEQASPELLQVGGYEVSTKRHAGNPIALFDVYFRVGGAGVGRALVNLLINSNDTIVDHTWIWRADHGKGVGWDENTSRNGLIVNGSDVTIYGLFVEHHQQYQVLWNGERGRTYFYQSEIPYDPPTQRQYTSGKLINGWASYKVADEVKHHEAWGLGIYSVFLKPDVKLERAIEVPKTEGVKFHHMITVALLDKGEISNVINDAGGATKTKPRFTPKLAEYPE